MRFLRLVSTLAFICGMMGEARAGISYSYVTSVDGSTSHNLYTGEAIGSEVAVKIYLQETLTGGSNSFINSNGGLIGAGAAVNVVGTTGGTQDSIVGGNSSAFTANSSFGNAPVLGTNLYFNQGTGAAANNLEFTESITKSQSTVLSLGNQGNDLILLGTFDVTVGTGTTTYILTSLYNDTIDGGSSALGQINGNTVTELPANTPPGFDIDSGTYTNSYGTPIVNVTGANAATGFEFIVTSAPEPSSVMLTGLVFVGLGFGINRRLMNHSPNSP